ncbi:hypothetical protein LMG26686_01342 [Achromobacter mucicolens]|uniref:hypothetical protein n=1 Tax=Achromobacter mucicolens TaxID=1389922 RepID=UPI0014664D6B|nr:hypothetical protein [Achromobacter mucicolens]CAB3838810.1 hypothetical protein LMG26686_01342 [Achromobacter mucicolens]
MELKVNIDLEAAVAQALAPEKLQPILDKHITEAITSAIKDATGYRSKFREAVEAQLTEAMPHGLKIDDVAKFQHVLNAALQSAVHTQNSSAVHAALVEAAKVALPDVPTVVKMSELMTAAREGFLYSDERAAFFARFDQSDGGGGWLYLDKSEKPGKGYGIDGGKYSAEYQLAFQRDGSVYALKLRDKQVTPASRPDVISNFDAMLMAMYVGRTRLELDMDPDDVESAASEQYDD